MKLTIDAKAARDALAMLKPAVSHTSYGNPVLTRVQVQTTADGVRFRATDLDIFAEVTVPAVVHAEGCALVTHKALADALKGKGAAVLVHEQEAQQLTVSIGAMVHNLGATFPVDEWPKWVPEAEHFGTWVSLPTAQLEYVLTAASRDAQRPPLHGVCVTSDHVVATDSYRLHAVKAVPSGEIGADGVIVGLTALLAADKAARKLKVSAVRVDIGQKYGRVQLGTATFYGRIVEAQFPNWRQLIPASTAKAVTVNAQEVREIVAAFPRDRRDNANVKLIHASDSTVIVRLSEPVVEATASATWENSAFGETACAFNPAFLADLLNTGEQSITLRGTDHLKPWMIEADGVLGLLMPVRTA